MFLQDGTQILTASGDQTVSGLSSFQFSRPIVLCFCLEGFQKVEINLSGLSTNFNAL